MPLRGERRPMPLEPGVRTPREGELVATVDGEVRREDPPASLDQLLLKPDKARLGTEAVLEVIEVALLSLKYELSLMYEPLQMRLPPLALPSTSEC